MDNEEIINSIKEHFENVSLENGSFSDEMIELIRKEMLQAVKDKNNSNIIKEEQH